METTPTLMKVLTRGFRGACPRCGEGKIFRKYLKVSDTCPACSHDLAQYPADDGPAYFTILLTGHLVVAPLLFFPFIWKTPAMIIVPATLIPLTAFTLALLPRIKGAFIGVMYRMGVKASDAHMHSADYAD